MSKAKQKFGGRMKSYHPIWTVIILFQIMILGSTLHGCGMLESRAGDAQAVSFPGPDGSTCYVIYDNGKAVGGNCK